MRSLEAVYEAVDSQADRYIHDLQRLVQQPSVSSQNIGVRDCGMLLIKMLEEVGATGRLIETPWHPFVYGEAKSPLAGAPTVLIYNHYDVQPADPVELWTHPPFGAEIVDGVLYGRGATDAKGNLMAHLKAIDAFQTAGVPLPCNIKFIFDGEEESGSPNLPGFVEANKDLLQADATLSFDAGFNSNDKPVILFGNSGLLFVEIRVKGSTQDLHSGRARLVENPAWRIVWALSKLKGPDGRINLEGFYDTILPVSKADRIILAESGWDDAVEMKALGVTRFVNGVSGIDALETLIFTPTCNIAGFAAGYMGEGSKNVLPSLASCRIDFRLVSDQDPHAVLASLRQFLDANGCEDFEMEPKIFVPPARTATDSPMARLVIEAAKSIYAQGPAIIPRADASGMQAVWLAAQLGGLPAAQSGVGPPAWRGHAPDEFMKTDYLLRGIKYSATILELFGRQFAHPDTA